jgi:hypothetical protein
MKPDRMSLVFTGTLRLLFSVMLARFQRHDLIPAKLVYPYELEDPYQSESCHINVYGYYVVWYPYPVLPDCLVMN